MKSPGGISNSSKNLVCERSGRIKSCFEFVRKKVRTRPFILWFLVELLFLAVLANNGWQQRESSRANFLVAHFIFLPVVGTVEGELSVLTNSASPFIKIGSNVIQIGEGSTGALYVAAFVMSRTKDESTPTRTYADATEEGMRIWNFIFLLLDLLDVSCCLLLVVISWSVDSMDIDFMYRMPRVANRIIYTMVEW